jgi:hypothetical protein
MLIVTVFILRMQCKGYMKVIFFQHERIKIKKK